MRPIATVAASLSACLAGALLIAGCSPATTEGGDNTPTGGGGGPKTGSSGKQLKLAFITNNASDFWVIARKGTEKADKELENVTVDFKIPGEGTAAAQTSLVNDLLSTKVDGFAISLVDPKNQVNMVNSAATKALVFTQDSDAANSNRVCYIGTNNRAAGKQAGELIKQALPNGGDIMLFVGKKDAQNAHDREMGIRDAIQGTKINIIDVRTDDADHGRAKNNAADALVKYPKLAAMVGLWSYNTPAILNAVKAANKVGKIKIIGFDEEADTLAGVKSGAIVGTIVQQPFEFGYQSIISMAKYLNGDKTVVPTSKQVFVPTLPINKGNVDAFSANLKKLTAK